MSTRSIISEPHGDGFRGRYCHSDGYPYYVGKELHALVQRDGVDKVRQTLIHDRYGWSSLGADKTELPEWADNRFVLVPGYGVAYTTEQGQSSPDDWNTDHDEEYTYILADSELWVFSAAAPDSPVLVPYADTNVDWEAVTAQVHKAAA